jgi:hypothetical protein
MTEPGRGVAVAARSGSSGASTTGAAASVQGLVLLRARTS